MTPARGAAAAEEDAGIDVLASVGFIGGVVLALGWWLARDPHRTGDTLAAEWLLVGFVTPLYVFVAAYAARLRLRFLPALPWLRYARPASASLALIAIAIAVTIDAQLRQRSVVFLAALMIAIAWARDGERFNWQNRATLVIVAATSWSLTASISFTPISELLLSASPSTALMIPAFVLATIATVSYFSFGERERSRSIAVGANRLRFAIAAAAAVAFVIAGLRTDGVLTDFVLYHRGYYVAPAEMVRGGSWLLWDIPSQYGFLSILTLAVLPAHDRWEALDLLIAISLTIQACCAFAVLEAGRSSVFGRAFAAFACLCAFFGSGGGRFPFGARLYPQSSLRTIFIVGLIAVMFAAYRTDASQRLRRRLLDVAGYAIWLLAVLWSFETGAWATVVWAGYLAVETMSLGDVGAIVRRALRHGCTFATLLATAVGMIETIYRLHFGHGPDWYGYVEFNLLYADDPVYHVQVDRLGPGWLLVLQLGCLAAAAIVAIASRRLRALPPIAGCWLAVWATASYYAGEPYSNHVAALVPILVMAIAALESIVRLEGWSFRSCAISTAMWPTVIVLIALAIGSPGTMVLERGPLLNGGSLDPERSYPTVSGDLRDVLRRAGIAPGADVIFSNGFAWTKVGNGLLTPFARVGATEIEYRAWLPVSPWGEANMIYSLPYDRVRAYVRRSLAARKRGGWYVTYREPADCSVLSSLLHTTRVVRNRNYEAALCRYEASAIPSSARSLERGDLSS